MRLSEPSWLLIDAVTAAVLTGTAAVFIAHDHQLGLFPGSVCVLLFCAGVALRRRLPVFVSTAAGILFAIPDFTHTAAAVNGNSSFAACGVAMFMYCYTLGSRSPTGRSLIGLASIEFGVTASVHPFNPLSVMLSVGPWLCGLTISSRRRASSLLELRARELEEEREVFARESVRYERARIARELHDIVAHCVSLMVVQANAGDHLATADPGAAAEAFGSISEAARQAQEEIARFVELLGESTPMEGEVGTRIVEELVGRARASGLVISCHITGDIDDVGQQVADAVYRVVQEGTTNAMKHAPGTPIRIVLGAGSDEIELHVMNDRPTSKNSGLEVSGGSNGLIGLRNRVAECGGTFSAGERPDGGWGVDVHLPRRARLALRAQNGAH